jgi:hypothetical protein
VPDAEDTSKTYFWDFFGPRAPGTARHFEEHLKEFLNKNALEGCVTGLASEGEGHQSVYCRTPRAAQSAVERALRPKRSIES